MILYLCMAIAIALLEGIALALAYKDNGDLWRDNMMLKRQNAALHDRLGRDG